MARSGSDGEPSDAATDHLSAFRTLEEEYERIAVDVTGSLPNWLDGVLYRNGPGRFTVGGKRLNHWFDGLALLRRFAVDGAENRVTFSAKFLRSEEYESVVRRGRLRRGQFGTPATTSILGHLRAIVDGTLTDNASIGFDHDGTTLQAITETPRGVAIDPETLRTEGHVDRVRDLPATGVLGHPHETDDGGGIVNLGTRIGRESGYVLYRQRRGGDPETITKYPARKPAYVHSFGLTPRYAVVFESPFRMSPRAMVTPGAFLGGFSWDPDRGATILVFDRRSGYVVASPGVEPAFVFHHVNAFEADGDVVVDVVAYPDEHAVTDLSLEGLSRPNAGFPAGELRRYRLPVHGSGRRENPLFGATSVSGWGSGGVRSHVLHSGPIEFPTTNYSRVNGRRYRYCYGAGHTDTEPTSPPNRVVKVDLASETESASWHEPNTLVGEPLFVPSHAPDPNGNTRSPEEDDGVLLVVVIDGDVGRSVLVILDAASLSDVARVNLPITLPFGFHGQFYRRDGRRPRRSMA